MRQFLLCFRWNNYCLRNPERIWRSFWATSTFRFWTKKLATITKTNTNSSSWLSIWLDSFWAALTCTSNIEFWTFSLCSLLSGITVLWPSENPFLGSTDQGSRCVFSIHIFFFLVEFMFKIPFFRNSHFCFDFSFFCAFFFFKIRTFVLNVAFFFWKSLKKKIPFFFQGSNFSEFTFFSCNFWRHFWCHKIQIFGKVCNSSLKMLFFGVKIQMRQFCWFFNSF